VDLAWPDRKLALEIDGSSHRMRARLAQDRKKDAVLEQLGWRVFRVSNGWIAEQKDLRFSICMLVGIPATPSA